MSLEALQANFQAAILESLSTVDAAIAHRIGPDIEQRLDIYREAYGARLVGALRDLHGHAGTYLGDDDFTLLALEYAARHPSASTSLRDYGRSFAAWLEAHSPHSPAGGLARLDLALRNAFDGPDATPVTLAALAGFPAAAWERATFTFHPTATRLRLPAGAVHLWRAIDAGLAPPKLDEATATVEVLAWRIGVRPHFRTLGEFEAAALDALMAGQSFGPACEQLQARNPEVDTAREVGALLRRWVEEELLCGLQEG